MTGCPSDEELSAFVERALDPAALARVQEHVAGCGACGGLVGLLLASAPEPAAKANGFDERYELRQRLGAGAMGEVYAAYDRKLARVVALKWLKAGVADAERGRALREAQALAKLAHPNVVHVYDVVELDGDDVISMEFVEGKSLRQWLAEGHPPDAVKARFVESAAGLGAAHAAGLVHRDFKPENVLVGQDSVARVVDFGLSKELRRAPSPGQAEGALGRLDTATSAGTPRYMAPELWAGRAADAASDQFAWGVALYEALCAEGPFSDQNVSERLAEMQRSAFVRSPRFRAQPAGVRRVLQRALAPDAAQRFPSMREAGAALAARGGAGRWLAAAAAALLVALGAGARYQHLHQCDGAGAAVERSWGGAEHATLERALDGLDVPYHAQLAREALRVVDAWAERWRSASVEACAATRLRGEAPEAVEGARYVCLGRTRAQLDAQLALLQRVTPERAGAVLSALLAVPLPDSCLATLSWGEGSAPVRDPALAAKVSAAEAQLDQVRAAVDLGLYADVGPRCASLLDAARALGRPGLEAAADVQCGRYQVAQRQLAAGQALLQDGLALALRHDVLPTAVEASTALVSSVHMQDTRAAVGGQLASAWFVVAEALLGRAGLLRSQLAVRLWTARASAEERTQNLAAAVALRERALETLAALGRADSPDALEAQAWLSVGQAAQGRQTAADLAAAAVDALTARLGGSHPMAMRALAAQSITLRRLRRYDAALEAIARERAVAEGLYGVDSPRLAPNAEHAGEVSLLAGRAAAARTAAAEAERLFAAKPGSEGAVVRAQVLQAEAALVDGARADACRLADGAIAQAAAVQLADTHLARAQWVRARCAQPSGAARGALAEQARALEPRLSADAQWAREDVAAELAAAK